MKSILDFVQKKQDGQSISMLTCYDHWSAQILNDSDVDAILVGDSLSMVMHGHDSTLPATTEVMCLHSSAVVKGAPDKFVITDMPFLSYRKDLSTNMSAVEKIMQTGPQAIKLEGANGNRELIKHCVESGVPVMGHLGLTPQSIHQLGGFKVQGRDEKAARLILDHAKQLEDWGCFSVVLECVPSPVARQITNELSIPTIGIGAGLDTDGQVLVLQDMLGMNKNFKPKFLRQFMNGYDSILRATNSFHSSVVDKEFPSVEESYE